MRVRLATVLVLVAATGAAFATPAVTVSPVAGGGTLDLDGEGSTGTHIVKVADVSLWTDAPAGFTVSISSGNLTKADGRTPIPFQVVLVQDGASAPAAAAFTIPSGSSYAWSSTTAGAVEKDLYIKYTPAALQDPGAYTAAVDIDIVDN